MTRHRERRTSNSAATTPGCGRRTVALCEAGQGHPTAEHRSDGCVAERLPYTDVIAREPWYAP